MSPKMLRGSCPCVQKLYFAEYDLMFFKNRQQMLRHLRKTKLQHPPGDEIYRNGNVSMFEIDGRKERMYCQVPTCSILF
jgi:histone acetyltransferase MYST1